MLNPELKFVALSDIGKKYAHNEDCYSLPGKNRRNQSKSANIQENGYLFVLCDGMGGANAGEVASELACNWMARDYYSLPQAGEETQKALSHIISEINSKIHKLTREHEQYMGMGTTLVSALFRDGKVFVNSVGDSRVYLYRDNNLQQITEDQSEVWDLFKIGAISKDDIRAHPRNHILKMAIGIDEAVEINQYEMETQQGDIYLLCSDGLSDMVPDSDIQSTLSARKSLKRKARQLVKEANRNGGRDNISVVLIQIIR